MLLASFGIVARFLVAGLDIDGPALPRNAGTLAVHGLIWVLLVALVTAFAQWTFRLAVRPAIRVSLALVTPSTGFILSATAAHEIGRMVAGPVTVAPPPAPSVTGPQGPSVSGDA